MSDISKYKFVLKSAESQWSYTNVWMEATHKCVFDRCKQIKKMHQHAYIWYLPITLTVEPTKHLPTTFCLRSQTEWWLLLFSFYITEANVM